MKDLSSYNLSSYYHSSYIQNHHSKFNISLKVHSSLSNQFCSISWLHSCCIYFFDIDMKVERVVIFGSDCYIFKNNSSDSSDTHLNNISVFDTHLLCFFDSTMQMSLCNHSIWPIELSEGSYNFYIC